MSKKCSLISLGQLNRYMFLIFLGAVFSICVSVEQNFSTFGGNENPHPVIYTLTYSLGLSLSFIIYMVNKLCYKSLRKNIINSSFLPSSKDSLPSPFKANKTISKKQKILWILISSIIDFVANCIYSYIWADSDHESNNWSFDIIFISLFSFLILKTKLHRHNYVSIAPIFILGIIYNIISIDFYRENKYLNYLIVFVIESVFSILFVFYKFFMIKKYIKSYEILFYQGIFETIIGIITLIVTTKIGYLDNFWDYYEKLNIREVSLFILLIVSNFASNLIIFIVIDLFTPFHSFLITMLNDLAFYFFNTDDAIYIITIKIVLFIICFIMVLVYIEVILLNFCGLSDMTKKNIELRAQLDKLMSENDEEDDEDEDDKRVTLKGYEISLIDADNEGNNIKSGILPLNSDAYSEKDY